MLPFVSMSHVFSPQRYLSTLKLSFFFAIHQFNPFLPRHRSIISRKRVLWHPPSKFLICFHNLLFCRIKKHFFLCQEFWESERELLNFVVRIRAILLDHIRNPINLASSSGQMGSSGKHWRQQRCATE